MKSFGSKELIKCLKELGFKPNSQNATSHLKFSVPDGIKINAGDRDFIMIQTNRREFDPHARTRQEQDMLRK
ncbi:hypothetical protein HYS91_05560 [Candidatus Daviesbacteria bacterium]|nr:hypothetical protein [Candidatus Daviesbacteria bacterium]